MKILLLVLVIVVVIILNRHCSEGFFSKESLTEPTKKISAAIHVSVYDGSDDNKTTHIKGQVSLVNALMTFGHYWREVLQRTTADNEQSDNQLEPLIYTDLSLNSISHMSIDTQTSPNSKLQYIIGTVPQAEFYEFQLPQIVGAVTHKLGEKLDHGTPEQADRQRYVAEFICRPDIIPILHMRTKQQFFQYIKDYIKVNIQPYLKSVESKMIPYTEDEPIFQFKII